MQRFAGRWRAWDEATARGERPEEVLDALPDETLLELLASGHPEGRRDELGLIATEMLHRLRRFRSIVGEAAQAAKHQIAAAIESAGETSEAAAESQKSIEHHVEVRQDQVEDEPQLAQKTARAARATVETLDEIRGAEERLVRLGEEATRHARGDE